MGIKQRRIEEKDKLKKSIVSAAKILFKEQGSWQGVTIRKIATAIDYSLPTIYEYFENKDDLLKVIQQEGYATLCCMLNAQLGTKATDSLSVLSIIAQTYWDFAWQHPELYQIMHNQKISLRDHEEAIFFIRAVVQQALQGISLHEKKPLSQQFLDEKTDCMRAIIHGFIMLSLAKDMEKQRAYMLMMQTLNDAVSISFN